MIGQRIQKLRIEKNLSLSELADRAGIAKSYLSSIERDIRDNPSIQVLEKICSVLDVDVATLLSPVDDTKGSGESQSLDPDWLALVREAMQSGISKEQFREVLEFARWRSRRVED